VLRHLMPVKMRWKLSAFARFLSRGFRFPEIRVYSC
jgi:hypothetical protein